MTIRVLLVALPAAAAMNATFRLAFGSCMHQHKPVPALAHMLSHEPHAVAFLGDNLYNDFDVCAPWMTDGCEPRRALARLARALARNARELAHAAIGAFAPASAPPAMHELASNYEVLRAKLAPLFRFGDSGARVDARPRAYASWDDHDFGENDAGASFAHAADAQSRFCAFWYGPSGCPHAPDGVYSSHAFHTDDGTGDARWVQLILLDTRSHRTDLLRAREAAAAADGDAVCAVEAVAARDNDYVPFAACDRSGGDGAPTMLGEAQWAWLEQTLRARAPDGSPFSLRLLASPTQVLRSWNGQEAWANMPDERARLRATIAAARAERVVLLSGDVHYGELSVEHVPAAAAAADRGAAAAADGAAVGADAPSYPLYDLTSSGLTEARASLEPSPLRSVSNHTPALFLPRSRGSVQVWAYTHANDRRLGEPVLANNFGLVSAQWDGAHDAGACARVSSLRSVPPGT